MCSRQVVCISGEAQGAGQVKECAKGKPDPFLQSLSERRSSEFHADSTLPYSAVVGFCQTGKRTNDNDAVPFIKFLPLQLISQLLTVGLQHMIMTILDENFQ